MALPAKETLLAQLACDECPICYEEVTGPTTTTCKHTFCLVCLRHWLQTANTCPCCRAKLYEECIQSTPSNENRATVAASPPPYSDSDERRWRNIGLVAAAAPNRWIQLSAIPSATLRTVESNIQSLIAAVSNRNAVLTTSYLWSICTQLRLPLSLASISQATTTLENDPTAFTAVESVAVQLQSFMRHFLHPRSYRGGSVSPHTLKLFFTRMERRLSGLTG